jgi:glycosyltransferase involved in cell wall biosynthesis
MIQNENSGPLISVCIPTYNRGNFLKKAIESVLNQTYKNLEIIVVDNYSTDNTDQILKDFKDSRIKVYKNSNFGSIAVSRNYAVKQSKGDWIAFLDSDDIWSKKKLEICARYFHFDIVYHGMHVILQSSNTVKKRGLRSRKIGKNALESLILKGNPIACSSVLIRKTLFTSINGMEESQELVGVEDYHAWLKASIQTNKFKRIKKYCGYYRVHSENFFTLSTNKSLPIFEATKFLSHLPKKKVDRYEFNLEYISLRKDFLNDVEINLNTLFQVIKFSSFEYKLKSIWMLLLLKITRKYLSK